MALLFGKIGGAEGDRTPDLMTASHALSQLSYGPRNRFSYREGKSSALGTDGQARRMFGNAPVSYPRFESDEILLRDSSLLRLYSSLD